MHSLPTESRRLRPRLNANKRGMTTLETMLAATFMAFALTTSITTMQRAFLMLDTARNLTIGSQILQTAVETTTMLAWEDVSQFPAQSTLPIAASFTDYAKVGNRFTLTREVKKVRGNNELLEITFTLSWRTISGPRWRACTLLYSRYGCFDFIYNSAA